MKRLATEKADMISGMQPVLRPGAYVFASITEPALAADLASDALSLHREEEGVSMILHRDRAAAAGLDTSAPMHCITLNVYSSLHGVGLTAAVATALAEKGIACNMVAAFHHDHVFVPADQSGAALDILLALQDSASAAQS